ncbi:hypothetical protein ACET3Z_013078 [Daucus carota]
MMPVLGAARVAEESSGSLAFGKNVGVNRVRHVDVDREGEVIHSYSCGVPGVDLMVFCPKTLLWGARPRPDGSCLDILRGAWNRPDENLKSSLPPGGAANSGVLG